MRCVAEGRQGEAVSRLLADSRSETLEVGDPPEGPVLGRQRVARRILLGPGRVVHVFRVDLTPRCTGFLDGRVERHDEEVAIAVPSGFRFRMASKRRGVQASTHASRGRKRASKLLCVGDGRRRQRSRGRWARRNSCRRPVSLVRRQLLLLKPARLLAEGRACPAGSRP